MPLLLFPTPSFLQEAVLYTDETVAAAAAALSMGLVMLGTANERAINELIAYGRDTSHVKITRAVAMGVAFIMFGREEVRRCCLKRKGGGGVWR